MLRLAAVVERPGLEVPAGWPRIGELRSGWIRLHGGAGFDEIAAVVWHLAAYNRVFGDEAYPPTTDTMRAHLEAIVGHSHLILPGGIGAFQEGETGRSIPPSCCAGLEGWREWLDFENSGLSPWMGHDPWPVLERSGDVVRLCSDVKVDNGALIPGGFVLEISIADLRTALAGVQQDLRRFLPRLATWAETVAPGAGEPLSERFDAAFHVTSPSLPD